MMMYSYICIIQKHPSRAPVNEDSIESDTFNSRGYAHVLSFLILFILIFFSVFFISENLLFLFFYLIF